MGCISEHLGGGGGLAQMASAPAERRPGPSGQTPRPRGQTPRPRGRTPGFGPQLPLTSSVCRASRPRHGGLAAAAPPVGVKGQRRGPQGRRSGVPKRVGYRTGAIVGIAMPLDAWEPTASGCRGRYGAGRAGGGGLRDTDLLEVAHVPQGVQLHRRLVPPQLAASGLVQLPEGHLRAREGRREPLSWPPAGARVETSRRGRG